MKKLIYCALALASGLFATSCMQENLEPVQGGSTVTFTVSVPEVATKAIGDGSDINNLLYAVYRTEEDNVKDAIAELSSSQLVYCINPLDPKGDDEQPKETYFTDGKAHISLELIKNQKYLVLFWAQHGETWVSGEDFDLTNITYPAHTEDNPGLANSNNYEAFAGVAYVGEVTGSCSKNATLYRPFAQINLRLNDPVFLQQTLEFIEGRFGHLVRPVNILVRHPIAEHLSNLILVVFQDVHLGAETDLAPELLALGLAQRECLLSSHRDQVPLDFRNEPECKAQHLAVDAVIEAIFLLDRVYVYAFFHALPHQCHYIS